jgi:hypothetical protein
VVAAAQPDEQEPAKNLLWTAAKLADRAQDARDAPTIPTPTSA